MRAGDRKQGIYNWWPNRKPFLRYLKSRKHDSIGSGTLKTQDGNTVTDPHDKVEVLNSLFQSVFTTQDSGHIPDKAPSPYTPIPDIEITTQGVYNLYSCKIPWNR